MDITIDKIRYSAPPLDTFTQFHIARKLSPVCSMLEKLGEPEKDTTLLITLIFAQLSDSDAAFVLNACLRGVFIHDITMKSKLISDSGGLQFEGTSLKTLTELCKAILVENVGDFFRTALNALDQSKAVPVV